jgi:phage gpG-like protein
MSGEIISVNSSQVTVALGKFGLSLAQNDELMQEIGASQLLSIRRTFRDEGVPARSWAPLAPSTIRSNPKIYGAGHKLLIRSSRLLNSIAVSQVRPGSVTIGTNLVYAAVHQFGSRDRSTAVGPQTEAESKTIVDVKARSYFRISGELGVGRLKGAGRRKMQGPVNRRQVNARAHQRHQNIPPRPYMVFRPEDPARIRGLVQRYILRAKEQAGLSPSAGGAQ